MLEILKMFSKITLKHISKTLLLKTIQIETLLEVLLSFSRKYYKWFFKILNVFSKFSQTPNFFYFKRYFLNQKHLEKKKKRALKSILTSTQVIFRFLKMNFRSLLKYLITPRISLNHCLSF